MISSTINQLNNYFTNNVYYVLAFMCVCTIVCATVLVFLFVFLIFITSHQNAKSTKPITIKLAGMMQGDARTKC